MKTNQDFSISLKIEGSSVKKISLGNCQSQGARPYQEDRFGFSDISPAYVSKHGFTAIVADGMGGLSRSEVVSGTLTNAFVGAVFDANSRLPIYRQFAEAINVVNKAVQGSGGGSTVVAVHCCKKGVYWCSLGDSRIYLLHDNRLFLVTEDKDYKNTLFQKVLKKEMTYEAAVNDPQADSLAQYVGTSREYKVEHSYRPFIPAVGDKLLLCTDGVYNALSENELVAALSYPASKSAELLRDMVTSKRFSNQDNFTSVVIEFSR